MTSISTKNKLEQDQIFKISCFKEVIKKTHPHKHDGYFELIFISEGEGFHWIETENFQVNCPDLFFLKPGQLHYWQFTAIPKGFVLMFKEELLNPLEDNSILQMIRQLNEVTHIHLENETAFQAILEDILEVYRSDSSYARDILLGYLKVLFGKIASLSLSPSKSIGSAIPQSLCERFLAILPTKCPDLHKVSDYAALLHTSPQNLNQTCRKKIGKSAGELISDQMLLEAKRNILHTDQNINEIADLLHFNDASYFVKFFKKHTGETPHQYRARYFG